ncbi:unnamed protein product [Plutella xylostella]|uniref:(diamondback moth) hypothetical protein n=1 Tax=Plutella xylostella TaxID=51655 RepID=A0A8S4FY79_PLUXY|nr:uncharacterized protein LOC105387124 [Plutella xylostella]CAG9132371.1 unnamed protein product [Plutella xylostella]
MGSNTSKASNETADTQPHIPDVCPSSDPRSPTPEITRTPLQNNNGTKHNITKNVDLRKTFEGTKGEEKLIHNNPILSAVIKNHLQSYDPRSPTQDFERTPIVVSADDVSGEEQNIRQQVDGAFGSPCLENDGDVLDHAEERVVADMVVPRNLCDGFFDLTLDDSLKPDAPLGSSTASNDSIEKDISNQSVDKPTQLLETNFDYVEDNNETVQNEDSEQNGIMEQKAIMKFRVLENDPRSPSVGIDRTPIVVPKIDEESSEDNVEEMSDDTLIKVLQSTNAELRQASSKTDNNPEGLLIYEDESSTKINDTPKKSKSVANNGSRTPLSCMKNKGDATHIRSKSANTLIDPKSENGVAKMQKRVSHIPRLKSLTVTKPPLPMSGNNTVSLKNLTKAGVVGGDCENTPPHSHRDRWDKDSSIVL